MISFNFLVFKYGYCIFLRFGDTYSAFNSYSHNKIVWLILQTKTLGHTKQHLLMENICTVKMKVVFIKSKCLSEFTCPPIIDPHRGKRGGGKRKLWCNNLHKGIFAYWKTKGLCSFCPKICIPWEFIIHGNYERVQN